MSNSDPQHPDVTTDLLIEMLSEALAAGQPATLTVISNSMAPVLEVNDQVTLRAVDFESIKKGDIITVTQREALFTHRVVARRKGEIVTRGDRNFVLDEPVTKKQILGKVTSINPPQSRDIIDFEAPRNQYRLSIINRLTVIEFSLMQNLRNFAKPCSVVIRAAIRRMMTTMKKKHQQPN